MVESQHPDPSIEGVLSQLGHAANLGISPEEFLTRAIDGLLQVTQAPAGVACLVNPEGNKLEVVSIRRIGAAVARTLPHAFHLDVERGSGQFAGPIRIGLEELPGLGELHARLRAEGVTGGILLPLSSDGRLRGLLIAMYRAGAEPARTLTDSALAAFQQQLSTALQNATVRQRLQSLNMDLLRLLTLAKILGEPRELEDTLTMVAQVAKSFSSAVATVVWLADPAAKQLTRIVALEPKSPERLPRTKLAYGEGAAGWVAESGEALHLDDALSDPRVAFKQWAKAHGVRSVYALPLRFFENLVGVLSFWTAVPLPPSQLSLLGIYCDHAALAIGHARLLRDNTVHAEQLSTLVSVTQTANKGKSAPAMLRVISDACRRTVGARSFSIWRADNRTRELSLLYADPVDGGLPRKGKRVGFGSGLLGWTALRRKPRITADVSAELPAADAERYRKSGIQASVTLPLLLDKELLGVLYLGAAAPLSAEDLRLVEGYGALAARAVAHLKRQRRKR